MEVDRVHEMSPVEATTQLTTYSSPSPTSFSQAPGSDQRWRSVSGIALGPSAIRTGWGLSLMKLAIPDKHTHYLMITINNHFAVKRQSQY